MLKIVLPPSLYHTLPQLMQVFLIVTWILYDNQISSSNLQSTLQVYRNVVYWCLTDSFLAIDIFLFRCVGVGCEYDTLDPSVSTWRRTPLGLSLLISQSKLLDEMLNSINPEILHPKEDRPRVLTKKELQPDVKQHSVGRCELLTWWKCPKFEGSRMVWMFHY